MKRNSYNSMFYNCDSITNPPALPATVLDYCCYSYMFYDCDKLETLPYLPAKTLVEGCYKKMFSCCPQICLHTMENPDNPGGKWSFPKNTVEIDPSARVDMFENTEVHSEGIQH